MDEVMKSILERLDNDYGHSDTLTECISAGIAFYDIKNYALRRYAEYNEMKKENDSLKVPNN